MDEKVDGWNKTVTKKPSRWTTPAWVAFTLLIASISTIGLLAPSKPPLPKPLPGEEVSLMATEIIVQKDGSLAITENTRTNLEGKTSRHGISRRLPSLRIGEDKKEFPIRYDEQRATIELLGPGHAVPEPTQVNAFGDENRFTTYRIGNSEVALKPGKYEFVFQYVAHGAVHPTSDGKATGVRWNVTGGLLYPIAASQIRVKLPAFIDPQTVQYGAFLGVIQNATDSKKSGTLGIKSPDISLNIERSPDEKDVYFTFKPNRGLAPFEHFIVNLSWPPGFLDGGL